MYCIKSSNHVIFNNVSYKTRREEFRTVMSYNSFHGLILFI